MNRTLTFSVNVNLDEVDGNVARAIDVLTEALEAEDMVDSVWQVGAEAKVLILSEGGDPRVYGPFENDSAADDLAPAEGAIIVALHDPDSLDL